MSSFTNALASSIIAVNVGVRWPISSIDKPDLFKSNTAADASCNTCVGKIEGPELKLCKYLYVSKIKGLTFYLFFRWTKVQFSNRSWVNVDWKKGEFINIEQHDVG
jgi:hypothetical protein